MLYCPAFERGEVLAVSAYAGVVTAKALSNYTRMMVDPDGGLDEAVKQLMNELWLGGDEEIRENEEYFISAMTEIQNLIEVKKSAFSKY